MTAPRTHMDVLRWLGPIKADGFSLERDGGESIADIELDNAGRDEEVAAAIAHVVNLLPELVEALERASRFVQNEADLRADGPEFAYSRAPSELLAVIDAVLAKANEAAP